MTIRARLLTSYLIVMALILLAFSSALYWIDHRRLTAEVDMYLEERIGVLVARLALHEDEISVESNTFDPDPGLVWQITLPSGRALHRSGPYRDIPMGPGPSTTVAAGETVFWTVPLPDDEPLRIARHAVALSERHEFVEIHWRDPGNGSEVVETPAEGATHTATFVVFAGKSLAQRNAALSRLFVVLAVSVPTLFVLVGVAGFVLVGRVLAPVEAITRTAARVNPDRLSARVPEGSGRDEISRLAQVINRMLERIDAGFEREKQFASDVSHELRTPLTVLRGEVEVALRRARSSEEYRRVLERSIEEVGRMERIVEGLLFLARAEAGWVKPEAVAVDLAMVLRGSVESLRRLSGAVDVLLPPMDNGRMVVQGSWDLLETLFRNLLDNALKYGKAPITVGTDDEGPSWSVAVADAGPGLAPEDLPHLFDRFYRADRSRTRTTGGAGLGLSICKWVAEAHGGSIRAENGSRGGALFTVVLPKATDRAASHPHS